MSDEVTRGSAGLGAWAVRVALVAVAFAALLLAQIEDDRFRETAAAALRFDLRQWSATITPLVIAGALFAIATRYPFPRPRYGWGRLVLAVVALLPALHLGFVMWSPQFNVHWPVVLITPRWFDDGTVPAVCAALAGVAIGSGFGARRAGP
ncbi:MAG: hypothetical protein ACRDH7_05170 [Actinomycetota bacterium]